MKLFHIVDALPPGWEVRKEEYARKVRREELDAYEVGLRRIKDMMLPYVRFTEEQITEIGRCSINYTKILVTRVDNVWVIMPCTSVTCRNGGHIVKGDEVITLNKHRQGDIYKMRYGLDRGDNRIVRELDTEDLFHAFKGQRTHKGKKKGGESSTHRACTQVCKVEDHSRPWKRGERAKMKKENKKRAEAELRERTAIAIIRVSQVGLTCRPKAMR